MSIELHVDDRIRPYGMSVSAPLRVASFPTERTAVLIGDGGRVFVFDRQTNGAWRCDLGSDKDGPYFAYIDHRAVFEPRMQDVAEAVLIQKARTTFDEVCLQAGVQPTDARWDKMKGEFIRDAKQQHQAEQARKRAGHFAGKRRAYLAAMNKATERLGCHVDQNPDGDGIFIVSTEGEGVTHIQWDHRSGFYVAVGGAKESPTAPGGNPPGVEDDQP